jgi:isoquinoline 1-oxidoreductase beta subunit
VTQAKLTAGIDADGNVVGFHFRISGQSISASLAPERLEQGGMDPTVFQGLSPNSPEGNFGYNFPNLLIDHAMRNTHVLAGFWRGVNVNHNAIYTECFVDEVAHALGQDPLAFRLKYLKPKHAAVLKAAAEKAGWGSPAPQGVFRGLAQYMSHGSYVAACAEVSVSPQGVLKMRRIVAATDPGYAVNPAQIERQVAGSFVFGLSALLRCSMAKSPSRTAPSSRPISTPTIPCVSVRCRRLRSSSCRPAASGAASESRPCPSRALRCSTRSSPRPAGGCARSR